MYAHAPACTPPPAPSHSPTNPKKTHVRALYTSRLALCQRAGSQHTHSMPCTLRTRVHVLAHALTPTVPPTPPTATPFSSPCAAAQGQDDDTRIICPAKTQRCPVTKACTSRSRHRTANLTTFTQSPTRPQHDPTPLQPNATDAQSKT